MTRKPSVRWLPEHTIKLEGILESILKEEVTMNIFQLSEEFPLFSPSTMRNRVARVAEGLGYVAKNLGVKGTDPSKYKDIIVMPAMGVVTKDAKDTKDTTVRSFTGADRGKQKFKAQIRSSYECVYMTIRAASEESAKKKAETYGEVLKLIKI